MTEDEILGAVRASFGDLVDRVERIGTGILVSRKEPECAMDLSFLRVSDPEGHIYQRIESYRDVFVNGLRKLKAAGGDHKKAWANG